MQNNQSIYESITLTDLFLDKNKSGLLESLSIRPLLKCYYCNVC